MTSKIAPTHLIFLAIAAVVTAFISSSAVSASAQLHNLVIVAPVAAAIAVLVVFIAIRALRQPREPQTESDKASDLASTFADLGLLALFALFCIALTPIGFDAATFLFVWIGVVLGGERRWWLPPLYSAAFTLLLVFGLGSLFPFPMPMLVL
ncbi:tripartite tricarboxylate transporter TctB family protein [Pelagibacterium luteolum]|uniref:Tripartite tricarboxylate transporter TctB family protein n=1 Tax=Pelagibacterium luteolum TaxID=440168 RepID=A0A1G7XUV1_9HYPH|nr:tripartite tricarboxylate transporter TctB family protein [Pelagibacterium luteolum]SDG87988.1 Tripartite tricarboxylate transporter TctB family protein [Pelagibacterium luteolum]